jgi:hypothetical protein
VFKCKMFLVYYRNSRAGTFALKILLNFFSSIWKPQMSPLGSKIFLCRQFSLYLNNNAIFELVLNFESGSDIVNHDASGDSA